MTLNEKSGTADGPAVEQTGQQVHFERAGTLSEKKATGDQC